MPKNSGKAKILTAGPHHNFGVTAPELTDVAKGLSTFQLDIEQIIDCIPDVILADIVHPHRESFILWAEEILKKTCRKVRHDTSPGAQHPRRGLFDH
jgi:hypothetical protein